MKPILWSWLAAMVWFTLHAEGAAAQSAEPGLETTAVPVPPAVLSLHEMVRLHRAVASLLTYPDPDALATLQETRRLIIERLETAGPVSAGPAARN